MKSTNFLVATIDKSFNMFKETEGEFQFIEKVSEHFKRLEEISDGHHFYIDETAFEALGKSNFPLRFTRVFCKNPDIVKKSTDYRVEDIKMLGDIVASKDRFSPNCQIFFIGDSEFLLKASKYASKLLLTVVDRTYTDKLNITDVFPLEEMQKIYKKRRTITPEFLPQIKAYKEMKAKSQGPKTETTILDNGMILTKEIEIPEFDSHDEIMNTPEYCFYEYRK